MLRLIKMSLQKQRKKLLLIVIQFFIGFSALMFGMSAINNLLSFKESIKRLAPLDAIQIAGDLDNIDNYEEERIKLYEDIVKQLRENKYIEKIGIYDNLRIKFTPAVTYDNKETLLMANRDILELADFKLKQGSPDKVLNYSRQDKVIPVIVSFSMGKKYPMDTEFKIYDEENKSHLVKVAGVMDSSMVFWEGYSWPMTEGLNSKEAYIIAPEFKDFTSTDPYSYNLLITLKRASDTGQAMESIEKIYDEHNIPVMFQTIKEEVDVYYVRQKPVVIFTILFSLLLLTLSILGCAGTILSSIINRKYEFGIYFAMGFTKRDMAVLAAGEMAVLFLISYLASALIAGFGITFFLKDLGFTMGPSVILAAFGIMLVCMLLCTLVPVCKISRFQPIDLLSGRDN